MSLIDINDDKIKKILTVDRHLKTTIREYFVNQLLLKDNRKHVTR